MSVFTHLIAAADHPAQATADTEEQFIVGESPGNYTVTQADIIPEAALTAQATNYRTFELTNRGQAGAGTTVIASLSTDVAGGNWVAGDKKAMTLSATAANLNVAEGDVLEMVETTPGTGLAHPQLQVEVRGTPRAV